MTDPAIQQLIADGIEARDLRRIRDHLTDLSPVDIADIIKELPGDNQAIVFRILPRDLATDTFEYLAVEIQQGLLSTLGQERFAVILNEMAADDRTALLEEFPAAASRQLVSLLSKEERLIALTLLGYPEDSVGRLMNPDYIEVGEDWTIDQVLNHLRTHGRDSDTMNVIYVVDAKGTLINDLRIREVILASPGTLVRELYKESVVALKATDDQETAVHTFRKYDRNALPVVDSEGHMLGIVTVDDVLDIAEEEATEDIQKIGAVEALENAYMETALPRLIRKRALWLVILFLGELFTASAMGFFQDEIQKAVVLALFIPLIISSGGNSGSQATTLVIRALALGEITIRDWMRVMRRELIAGISLGAILGVIGFFRITVWAQFGQPYGEHWLSIAIAVSTSLVAVVLWGTLAGSMLPLILKKAGADPATASAPFVATLVDVTGLVIYFSVAHFFLSGVLL